MPLPKTTILATLALAAAAVGVAPAGASAANPYTAEQVCGPNYHVSREIPLRSNNNAVLLGRIMVLYGGGSRGKTCVVTMKVRQVGRPTFTSVRAAGYTKNPAKTRWKTDEDTFSYYAGPLYIAATPACVRVGGFMSVPGGREGIVVEAGYRSTYC